MALEMPVAVFRGRTMSPPLAFEFGRVRSVQSRQVHLLPADFRGRQMSTSWLSQDAGCVLHNLYVCVKAKSRKVLVKATRGSQKIRCSTTEPGHHAAGDPAEQQVTRKPTIGEILQKGLLNANASLPYAIVASATLAFLCPPSFTWFTTRYYAPALGFLMFAVGINLNAKAFLHAIERPAVVVVGYAGQFIVKPILGILVVHFAVPLLHLPSAIGTLSRACGSLFHILFSTLSGSWAFLAWFRKRHRSGLLLVACVSGAQLSNYATFLVDPTMAPLSIVMTALSTITAVIVTPTLSHLLLGKRLPVNVPGMMASITQIVVLPLATGLSLNHFLPAISNWMRPFLPMCSVLVTCCCVGAPLALNIRALKSQLGLIVVFPIFIFHSLAFLTGYNITKVLFRSEPDVEGLARTISFETGMQSSLLGLALANNFFEDPLVSLPSAISTVLMSLMGFGLAVVWQHQQKLATQ